MELGIFARTFARPTLEETLDAVMNHEIEHVQLNLACAGLPTLPESMHPDRCAMITSAFRERRLIMDAISGTFNMVHPTIRPEENLHRLEILASACRWLDTRIITLCTGSRDPENMWQWHPDNGKLSVFKELVRLMKQVAVIADRFEVTMAIEPEVGNVVNSALKARVLLDELGSPWIKVVIDPANLFHPGDVPRMNELLDEAFEWLGPDIVLAHAKELRTNGHSGAVAPGKGVLDWDHYVHGLEQINYSGPLIIHGLPETDVAEGIAFLRSKLGPPSGEN
jgi:sugar phosphate isomerase/epimerase